MTSVATRSRKPIVEQEPKATIYIRNYAKKAIMLTLPIRISQQDLREKIQRKMKVPSEEQALFLHGTIIPSSTRQLTLENKLIFHLVNLRRINLEKIAISVKRIEPNSYPFKYNINPQMKIGDFFGNQFARDFSPIQDFFLVYTGRELQLSKTFLEEYVEDQSEILAVHKVQNLKSQFYELRKPHSDQKSIIENKISENPSICSKDKLEEPSDSYSEKFDREKSEKNDELVKTEIVKNIQIASPIQNIPMQKQLKSEDRLQNKADEKPQNQQKQTIKEATENIKQNKIGTEQQDSSKNIKAEVKLNQQEINKIEDEQKNTTQMKASNSEEYNTQSTPIATIQNSQNNSNEHQEHVEQDQEEEMEPIEEKEDVEKNHDYVDEQHEYKQHRKNYGEQGSDQQYEETQEIFIGQYQKYSKVSSCIRGGEHEHPRRARSNSSNSKIEAQEEEQEQQEEDSIRKNQASAVNLGLTVISSRHEEEESINNSSGFKPINYHRIQRDGLDGGQNKPINTIHRTESANLVFDEDDNSRRQHKSQPIVPQDSAESQLMRNEEEQFIMDEILNAYQPQSNEDQNQNQKEEKDKDINKEIKENEDKQENNNNSDKENKYEISLYDIMFGKLPQCQQQQNIQAYEPYELNLQPASIEAKELDIQQEDKENKYEISLYDIMFGKLPQCQQQQNILAYELNLQPASIETKEIDIQQEDKHIAEDEANQQVHKQAQEEAITEKQIENNQLEELARNIEQQIEQCLKSQPKEQTVHIIDLRLEDNPVVLSNVFNPHYLQNEENKPTFSAQQDKPGHPNHDQHLEEEFSLAKAQAIENVQHFSFDQQPAPLAQNKQFQPQVVEETHSEPLIDQKFQAQKSQEKQSLVQDGTFLVLDVNSLGLQQNLE